MSSLSIVEVTSQLPYLQFYLELTDNTYFTFKMDNSKKNRKKMWQIVNGIPPYVSLWKIKTMRDPIHRERTTHFYLEKNTFFYHNCNSITEIAMKDEHYEAIHDFLLSNATLAPKKCTLS